MNDTAKDEGQESYSVKEAAVRLGKTERTVQRLVASGALSRDAVGRIPGHEVDALLEAPEADAMGQVIRELRLSLGVANGHAAAASKLLLESTESTLAALRSELDRLGKQNQEYQEVHLQLIGTVGDVLLKQEERAALSRESEARSAMLGRGFEALIKWAPTLAEQMGSAAKVRKAVASLTDEEAAMMELGLDQLPPERAAPLRDLLRHRKPASAEEAGSK